MIGQVGILECIKKQCDWLVCLYSVIQLIKRVIHILSARVQAFSWRDSKKDFRFLKFPPTSSLFFFLILSVYFFFFFFF